MVRKRPDSPSYRPPARRTQSDAARSGPTYHSCGNWRPVRFEQPGSNDTWMNREDADTVTVELRGEAFAESDESRLRDRCRDDGREGPGSRKTRDVDDSSRPPLDHAGHDSLAEKKRAPDDHVNALEPGFGVDFPVEARGSRRARVVHQQSDWTEPPRCRLHCDPNGCGILDVERKRECPATSVRDQRGGLSDLLLGSREDADRGSLRCKRQRDGTPDSTSTASDDRNFATQILSHFESNTPRVFHRTPCQANRMLT